MEEIQFVPKSYRMNPAEDTLLFDGSELKEGMTVLLEDYRDRGEPTADPSWDHQYAKIMTWARWMQVTRLKYVSRPMKYDDEVQFVGVYEDGSQSKIVRPARDAWLAKTETIPGLMDSVVEFEIPAPHGQTLLAFMGVEEAIGDQNWQSDDLTADANFLLGPPIEDTQEMERVEEEDPRLARMMKERKLYPFDELIRPADKSELGNTPVDVAHVMYGDPSKEEFWKVFQKVEPGPAIQPAPDKIEETVTKAAKTAFQRYQEGDTSSERG